MATHFDRVRLGFAHSAQQRGAIRIAVRHVPSPRRPGCGLLCGLYASLGESFGAGLRWPDSSTTLRALLGPRLTRTLHRVVFMQVHRPAKTVRSKARRGA